MALQTGTSGNDDFYDSTAFIPNSYYGGAGIDTLHLQVASDAVIGTTSSSSPYSFYTYTFTGGSFTLASTLTSIERIEFDSVAGALIGVTLDGDSLSMSGLAELIAGPGTDSALFLFSGANSTMPSNLTLTSWASVPTDAWETRDIDALQMTAIEQAGSSYTLNAAGLDVLQRLIGGAGNTTFNGSANADTLIAGSGVDTIRGNGGNDSIEVDSGYQSFQGPAVVYTNAPSVFDGGAGTDALSIGGAVVMQSTLVSIEGVDLEMPITPAAGPNPSYGQAAASLTLDSAHAAMLPRNAFFLGGGTVTIDVTNGTGFDGSNYVLTPSQTAISQSIPIVFDINGEDGNGLSYVGTSGSDTIVFGVGTQTATGGGGADIFVLDQGAEKITDFVPGVDKIDLRGITAVTNFSQVLALSSQVGADTVAHLGGSTLSLAGVSLSALTANDFIFGTTHHHFAANDIDGNGVSDVLLASPSQGADVWYLLPDQTFVDLGPIGNFNPPARMIGAGDFSGFSSSDLLFQTRDGDIFTYQLQYWPMTSSNTFDNPGPDYALVGDADFNDDGTSDLLFHNAVTGGYMTEDVVNGAISGGGTIGNPGADWVFKAAADFNGDGDADLLFQNADGSYGIWELADATVLGGGRIANPGAGWFFKGTGDFNGDGRADILFENASGTYAIWDMNGTNIVGGGTIGNPGAGFTLASIGDYNGDGRSDLLFRSIDGTLVTWTLDDTQITGGVAIGNPGSDYAVIGSRGADAFAALVFEDSASGALTSWQVGTGAVVGSGNLGNPGTGWTALATGDFGARGETDVLVRDASGNLALWVSDGATALGHASVANPGLDWSFAAVGDFNGDGRSDILFRNSATGAYASWDMDGTQIIGGGLIGSASGYTLATTADINGDGRTDLVFQNIATGDYAAWTLNDTAITGGGLIGNPGGTWTLKGNGDFNGDGNADLLFEDASGAYAIWDLDGTNVIGGGVIGTPGGTWQLAKIIDLNQDGKADLVFKDASGHVAAWLISDTSIIGGANLGAITANLHLI